MTTELFHSDREQIIERINRLAWLLDNSIKIPVIGYRIGLDSIIGLIPVLGDAVGMIISSYIVAQAVRLGVSRTIITRMIINIVLEGVIGSIPLIGDLFDAVFKANVRNARLLKQVVT